MSRRRDSFWEFFWGSRRRDFVRDVNRFAYLLYWATSEESELDPDVKYDLAVRLLKKLDRRKAVTKGRYIGMGRWDGRHWKGIEPIQRRIEASLKASRAAKF